MLTTGQHHICNSALSGPTKISGTFQQQLTRIYNNPTFDSALKQAMKHVDTPEHAQLLMSAPLHQVTTFTVGAYYISRFLSWVEFTHHLRARLGSTVGLNLQYSHRV